MSHSAVLCLTWLFLCNSVILQLFIHFICFHVLCAFASVKLWLVIRRFINTHTLLLLLPLIKVKKLYRDAYLKQSQTRISGFVNVLIKKIDHNCSIKIVTKKNKKLKKPCWWAQLATNYFCERNSKQGWIQN